MSKTKFLIPVLNIKKGPIFKGIISPDFTEQQLVEFDVLRKSGNIPAQLNMIMHNQLVLNHKLNRILNKLNEK